MSFTASFVYPDVVTLGAFVNFEGRGVVAFDDHLGWFWFGAYTIRTLWTILTLIT